MYLTMYMLSMFLCLFHFLCLFILRMWPSICTALVMIGFKKRENDTRYYCKILSKSILLLPTFRLLPEDQCIRQMYGSMCEWGLPERVQVWGRLLQDTDLCFRYGLIFPHLVYDDDTMFLLYITYMINEHFILISPVFIRWAWPHLLLSELASSWDLSGVL